MPGTYTHLALLAEAATPPRLRAVAGMPAEVRIICGRWRKYCELGVVSPDLPYLDLVHMRSAWPWADHMHYRKTDGVVKGAILRLRAMPLGDERDKALAWLLGYATHVVMDVAIHPVINLRVGPYDGNKTAHRVCEMNQDVHSFRRATGLTVTKSEFLDHGIGACRIDGQFDPVIGGLWSQVLTETYPKEATMNAPRPDDWHAGFVKIVDGFAEEFSWLCRLSRHFGDDIGVAYPQLTEVDKSFVENLQVPGDIRMHFDAVFDRTIGKVLEIWSAIASAVLNGNEDYQTRIGDWDLDTGKDRNGRLVFWP